MKDEKKIALLSANKYSAYSSSVLYLALKENIKVELIVVKKISGLNRIYKDFKRDKFGLVTKVFKKIILQRLVTLGFSFKNIDGFTKYFKENCDKDSSLLQLAIKNGIPIHEVSDFHEPETLEIIKEKNLDLMLFTGGGLIRSSLFSLSKYGVINCHMGILPDYRGMDCTYWAILNKDINHVGYTTHLIDHGVDTGAIIKNYQIKELANKNSDDLVKEIEYNMAPAIIESTLLFLDRKVNAMPQDKRDGKQYYVICKKLKKLANGK